MSQWDQNPSWAFRTQTSSSDQSDGEAESFFESDHTFLMCLRTLVLWQRHRDRWEEWKMEAFSSGLPPQQYTAVLRARENKWLLLFCVFQTVYYHRRE